MATPEYRLIETDNGPQYALYTNKADPLIVGEQVSIAYAHDAQTNEPYLMKHGESVAVMQWMGRAQAAFRATGAAGSLGHQMADELRMIHGRFGVEQLNDALQSSGALKRLIAEHNAIEVSVVQIEELPRARQERSSSAQLRP